jgi:hypothetical protein
MAPPRLQTGEDGEGAEPGAEDAESGQKKARALPAGPWKFWERMPERPVPCAEIMFISQVRKAQLRLRLLQHMDRTVEKPHFS